MRIVPKHRRLVVGSRDFKVFEYKKPFNSDTSDDNPIFCALFSPIRFEFYIAGERSINVWNARDGTPTRCFKNCMESDITAMALDKDHRKLIVGSHLGKLKVFDLLSGVMINVLDHHSEENGEVSFIGYGEDDLTIITTAWDKEIKIHKDDRDEQVKPDKKVYRGKENSHQKDIICGDYAHYLGLIATGGRDNVVCVWDYENMRIQDELIAHKEEVNIVKFLKPFPLLVSCDSKGAMNVWLLHLHGQGRKLVAQWDNKHSMGTEVAISAIDSYYNAETGDLILLLGDEKGDVKLQSLRQVIDHYKLVPIDIVKADKKRNPHRYILYKVS
jgi:WD40 repeat protein